MLRTVLFAAALGLLAVDASAEGFGAKPGAWENTVTTSGLTIPPEVLAKMPPDRRAMVEQQLSANSGQSQVRRVCITKEKLEQGFTPSANSSCTVQTVSRTASKMVMTTTCTSPVPSTGTMTWEAKSPESVVGSVDQDVQGRKVHITVVGKWLGASCDGI
jgi:hypothetical protein